MGTRQLYVAAGGGGDAIAAAMLHRAAGGTDSPRIATFSWDRLLVDPVPGPRAATDFEGLEPLGARNYRVTATSRPIAPAGSLLPKLAGALDAELLLMDPSHGAVGLTEQLAELADLDGLTDCALVDVGGDILATGHEPELRSPLADSLALAAVANVWTAATVLVAGAGLDGELPPQAVAAKCDELHGREQDAVSAEAARPFRELFTWHPSEASGLLCLAALGFRGTAEIRDQGSPVELSDSTAQTQALRAGRVLEANLIAQALQGTKSLHEVEKAIAAFGRESEIEYERRKQRHLTKAPVQPSVVDLSEVLGRLREATLDLERDTRFITMRRLAELLGLNQSALAAVRRQLVASEHPAYLGVALDLWRL